MSSQRLTHPIKVGNAGWTEWQGEWYKLRVIKAWSTNSTWWYTLELPDGSLIQKKKTEVRLTRPEGVVIAEPKQLDVFDNHAA